MSDFMNWDLDEVLEALASQAPFCKGELTGLMARNVSIDSRKVGQGDLFVCLKGDRFDAHDFATEVSANGAVALVVDRVLEVNVPQIVVKDTRRALGDLAAAWRNQFQTKVLGVVGSNGKTTTKEMLASICRAKAGSDKVLVTEGNLNNEIGVPLTLFRMREHHRFAVVEMGMNHVGEIDYLAGMVKPDVALLTNAQREHQEFMKSVEAVARENGSVFAHLRPGGVAVFPAGTEFDPIWAVLAADARCVRFGKKGEVQIVGEGHVELRSQDAAMAFQVRFLGQHNASNAAAASAAAMAAGCTMVHCSEGLTSFEPVSGRLQLEHDSENLRLINDTYNANPDSVNAASEVLSTMKGPRLMVLGDMGEVGDQSPQFHAEVGEIAKRLGIDRLYALGSDTRHSVKAFGQGGVFFDSIDSLNGAVLDLIESGAWTVLVKGSRFMKMERVVQAIMQKINTGKG